jgi:hypothetical protein
MESDSDASIKKELRTYCKSVSMVSQHQPLTSWPYRFGIGGSCWRRLLGGCLDGPVFGRKDMPIE